MLIINKIQKSIYDCLTSQNDESLKKLNGIFNCLLKNEVFPYIFMHTDKIDDLSTFNKNIYLCIVCLNIYDKNTSNSEVVILSEKIKNIILNISDFYEVNYKILNIKFKDFSICLENNGTIWNGKLNFEFIIEE